MNHLDTFSGIGGWALAARWMGWDTLAFVEKDKFCHKVLGKNFPDIPIHDDIFTFSGKPFRDRVDILTGSTPCQPFSQAGKREGSNDERHLFPEFLRVVAEVRPRWIVIENVYGLLNIESGQVFEDYHASLEGEGYAVQTVCVPASALNAPHRRDRVWIVGHSDKCESGTITRNNAEVRGLSETQRQSEHSAFISGGTDPNVNHSERTGRKGRSGSTQTVESGNGKNNGLLEPTDCDATYTSNTRLQGSQFDRTSGEGTRASRPITECDSDDKNTIGLRCNRAESKSKPHIRRQREFSSRYGMRIPGWGTPWSEVATELCRVDARVPNRVDRLKSLGNAIVPQVAYEIFKAIDHSNG